MPGRTIFRVLLPLNLVSHLPDITTTTAWWHGPAGHFYGSQVDDPSETPPEDRMFEIATHNVIDPATAIGKRFSWGIPCTNERVESFFTVSDFVIILEIRILMNVRITILESGKPCRRFLKVHGKNSQLLLDQD